jgi:hypothetical protein
MAKSKWEEYKEKNGVTPLDLLNPRTKHSNHNELVSMRVNCMIANSLPTVRSASVPVTDDMKMFENAAPYFHMVSNC